MTNHLSFACRQSAAGGVQGDYALEDAGVGSISSTSEPMNTGPLFDRAPIL